MQGDAIACKIVQIWSFTNHSTYSNFPIARMLYPVTSLEENRVKIGKISVGKSFVPFLSSLSQVIDTLISVARQAAYSNWKQHVSNDLQRKMLFCTFLSPRRYSSFKVPPGIWRYLEVPVST